MLSDLQRERVLRTLVSPRRRVFWTIVVLATLSVSTLVLLHWYVSAGLLAVGAVYAVVTNRRDTNLVELDLQHGVLATFHANLHPRSLPSREEPPAWLELDGRVLRLDLVRTTEVRRWFACGGSYAFHSLPRTGYVVAFSGPSTHDLGQTEGNVLVTRRDRPV